MPTYYVFHPAIKNKESSEPVTAEVDAPDPRHAVTAYLDFLTRSGRLEWTLRTGARRGVKTSRMSPGEIQTTVQLSYGGGETEIEDAGNIIPVNSYRESITEDTEPIPEEASVLEEAPIPEDMASVPSSSVDVFGGSPVVELSRRTMGL